MAKGGLKSILLVAAVGLGAPSLARGQSDPRLVAIVRLMQDGHADSARAELTKFLAAITPADSIYPEAVFTSAVVAANDSLRRLALRTVMIEFSRSSWADDAILMLAQDEYGASNPNATVNQITRLIEDYPASPLRAQAAFWGARAASDIGKADVACQWAAIGLAAVGDNVELRSQLDYQKQRCESISMTQRDSAAAADRQKADSTPPPTTATKPAPGLYVQVAAVPTADAAQASVDALKRLEYTPSVVVEKGLHKVRAGPFKTQAAARTALDRIRSRLGGKPFIVPVR